MTRSTTFEHVLAVPGKLTALFKRFIAPVIYASSSVALSGANLVTGILVIRWIQPEQLGVWHSARLAVTYSFFLLAGINNGLNRELPFYLGSSNENKARGLAATALYCNMVGCSLAFLGGIVATIVFWNRSQIILFSIIAVSILIICSFYRNYLTVTFRSHDAFRRLGNMQFLEASLLIVTVPLVFFFNFGGLLFRLCLVSVIMLIAIHIIRPVKVRPIFESDSFLLLAKTGFPIFALDYIATTAGTCDRLALLHAGGPILVGYYALSSIANETMSVIPLSIANYFYSRMSFQYGKHSDPKILWKAAIKISFIIPLIMLPICLVGYTVLPSLISHFFPKYINGIGAARVMLWVALFSGAAVGSNILWSLKAWKWMVSYQVTLSVMLALFPFAGVFLNHSPLLGVVYGLLISRIIAFLLTIWMTYMATHEKKTQMLPIPA
jgi:O-antigen/teichoic acid export membrane protein